MTRVNIEGGPARPLRTAAVGALTFTGLYVVHRVLQGLGPSNSTAAVVAAYNVDHRGTLLASEVAVGLALLAFIPFAAALVPVVWRTGQTIVAIAVGVSAAAFVAMGFLSSAAETALIDVADSHENAAVLALNELQARTPIVWTSVALVAAVSLAIHRTGLVWRWLGMAGFIAAAIFLVGSILSTVGRTPEGNSSLFGVGLFIVWMLVLGVALLRAEPNGAGAAQTSPASPDGAPIEKVH